MNIAIDDIWFNYGGSIGLGMPTVHSYWLWTQIYWPMVVSGLMGEQRSIEYLFGLPVIIRWCTIFKQRRIPKTMIIPPLMAILTLGEHLALTCSQILTINFSVRVMIGFTILTEVVISDWILLHLIYWVVILYVYKIESIEFNLGHHFLFLMNYLSPCFASFMNLLSYTSLLPLSSLLIASLLSLILIKFDVYPSKNSILSFSLFSLSDEYFI